MSPTESTTVSREAGRALDSLVAERVMGFWFEDGEWWTRHANGHSRAYATAYLNIWGPNYSYDGLPKFSTDIAAAWAVVEKLERAGPRHSYWWSLETKWRDDDSYVVRVFEGSVEIARGQAPTMPEAICRAALAAMEAKP